MTDLEISKALALAIGWKHNDVHVFSDGKVRCCRNVKQWGYQVFDYRDWNVIGPIAEKFDAFPLKSCQDGQWCSTANGRDTKVTYADTPQKAIALAVIGSAK